ncbi:peroxiredoxin family protein [Oceanobacillus polygoni]|uniref:Peroxiredoxin n=1 Tax=Oceanobacillus polygoni TaxID=1235259 RepID=A0A9X0YXH4_9BACI|nr:TlpA disulfide reductase family protein [Oceanobacillus polygoni]MBP2078736.1 peroxiredoxin [Oceanobacillus polygoni]
MKRIVSTLLFIAVFFSAAGLIAAENIGTEVGQKAPDFKLMTNEGETVQLSDFKGKRVLLNFWATWCPPCREEMPDMERFYKDKDAVVLAVNITNMEMNRKTVAEFIATYGLTFPVLMDEEGQVSSLYKISPIPTTYLIDSNGVIRQRVYGPLNYEQMITEYEKMD